LNCENAGQNWHSSLIEALKARASVEVVNERQHKKETCPEEPLVLSNAHQVIEAGTE